MAVFGVVLSGCGVNDGSEIHEATLLLLAIDKLGAKAACFAPDKVQAGVANHYNGKPGADIRNMLIESARIARGAIRPLSEARADALDALALPGGFGAAKNLSSFAKDGAACQVDPDLERLLRQMHAARKPIGAACIAPVILARVFGPQKPLLTIGDDGKTAQALEGMGARHQPAPATGVVVDEENRFVTTPCYMLAQSISQVAVGMDALVKALLELMRPLT